MKIWKILTGFLLLFLIIGIACATDIDNLKTPDNCKELKDGCGAYTNHIDRMLYVEKVTGDYKADWFTNTSDMSVSNVGDNIYLYGDNTLEIYGYQEIVSIDGVDYMVSINQGSKLSPSEENQLLEDMKDFNKMNNLEPIAV